MRKSLAVPFLMGFVSAALGCHNAQPRQAIPPQPVPAPPPRPMLINPAPLPPPGTMQQSPPIVAPAQSIPAPALPTNPLPAPPAAGPPNMSGGGPPAGEPITRVENRWQPSENGVRLGSPEAIAESKESARFYPPDKTPEPPLQKSATRLPVGIAQFAPAMDNVATGLRPSLDEGLDWLKERGYRTVVHVRLPEEPDVPDRKQIEKRGMKYVSLDVSPQTLGKEIVEEFNRCVRDTSGQPVFIYDRDGSLAGSLWYLYFRTTEQASDEVARIRAGALGLRADRDGPHRDMWLAVQKYLQDNSR